MNQPDIHKQDKLIDWQAPDVLRRIRAGRRQGLARAAGLDRHPGSLIFDATAGLGRDAYVLAALGARLELAERVPALQSALQSAIAGVAPDIAARLVLYAGDARDRLVLAHWDVVLLDPMFTDNGKHALPKKAAQTLREMVGPDEDAASLLPLAIAAARRRVVVKRAPKAPWLNNTKPAFQYPGTRARFDIYLGTAPALEEDSPCTDD
jgi:16S rRNA (guanine1516-N2)-methyltransferase